MLVIADYGVGNLASVKNMLKKAGFESVLASDAVTIESASKIILPGIGAFDHCMQQFNASGLREVVTRKVMEDKTPLLGICVGLQMLMENSEEGIEPGLGWFAGKTIKFKKDKIGELKIPHMGWTNVRLEKKSDLTENLGDQPRFYFVHSYHVQPENKSDELLSANYGYDFTAAISRDNIYGAQFHPEKSHKYGMKILENFARL
ncbi:MAG TPA: imidazole glycerol phosphate synthase subunit HisH [Puia sp.]|nr:imidazole glycerol phosphate synthase subunit HisH [Puia sp.]